jgi:hypothetical protein
MDTSLAGFSIQGFMFMGSIPITTAVVNLLKTFIKDSRWYPACSFGVSIILNLIIGAGTGYGMVPSFVMGVIAGLSASGLYAQLTSKPDVVNTPDTTIPPAPDK